MDFAAIMKDEIGRKRKKVESEVKVDNKKKYFKRSDLSRVQKEKYEERMGMKQAPPSEDRISALEQKTQRMLDRLGPDQVCDALFMMSKFGYNRKFGKEKLKKKIFVAKKS